ncbi:MAG: alginate export family protein [Phycisphaerae bacterium]|nr:alginate export family protein [Phycisphaerae bacterium]
MQPNGRHRARAVVWAAPTWLTLAATAAAQVGTTSDAFLQRQRAIEERNRQMMDRALPTSQRFLFDWGGWFDWYLFLFDDGDNSSRTQRTYDLRLWAGVTADEGVHEAYFRTRMSWRDWNYGDSFNGNEDDFEGPNLDRGYYQFDLTKALRRYNDIDLPLSLRAKVGRDFVVAGSGYAVSLPLDHVSVQMEYLDFQTTFILGRTPSSTPNIDRSEPVSDNSIRNFWIIEERWKGSPRHEPFVYIAQNSDHSREDPLDLLQNYRYDSTYIGFGSTGELVRNLRYTTEWVIERGTSYGDQRFLHKDKIKAWAFDQELEYLFSHKTEPRLSLEYMFASGDVDRLDSPTNAVGGNRNDHTDRGFVGFGFRDTGVSFAPRLSNIHIWRAGASFRPLPEVELARNLELGTNWFLYHKHRTAAAVSDSLADEQAGYLGWEMDYFANYRLTNDLSLTVRFGSFFPGDAFSDRTSRTFLLTGVTWSF